MDLVEKEEKEFVENSTDHILDRKESVAQEQIHGLLFGDKISWQAIIQDLIASEQLNPWDIDISLLAQKFLEKVKDLEEANFFISSKVLLAAAFLLRIKSGILLDKDIRGLDDILFGKKEEKKYIQERIDLDEDVPGLIPRTPLPRFKKVSLQELIAALGKAINTENRRIRRVVVAKQQEIEASLSLPRKTINLKDKITGIYERLKIIFDKKEDKYAFSELAGNTTESRIETFIPLLHLDNQHKIWIEQEGHFEEIWILLKHIYERQNKDTLENLRKEAEQSIIDEPLSDYEIERAKRLESEFKNPLGEAQVTREL